MAFQETFRRRDKIVEMSDGVVVAIDHTSNAKAHSDLPFNGFALFSQDAAAVVEIYLDQPSTSDNPDFTLQGKGSVIINPEDGVFFNVVYLKNKTGATIAANKLSYRVSHANEV